MSYVCCHNVNVNVNVNVKINVNCFLCLPRFKKFLFNTQHTQYTCIECVFCTRLVCLNNRIISYCYILLNTIYNTEYKHIYTYIHIHTYI